MGTGAKLLFFSKYVFNLSQKSLFNNKTTQQGGWDLDELEEILKN